MGLTLPQRVASAWGIEKGSQVRMVLTVIVLSAACCPVAAQQIYKCSDGKGGNTYQQVPCNPGTGKEDVRSYRPVPDAPRDYSTQPRRTDQGARADSGSQQRSLAQEQVQQPSGPTGYVRCVRPDGSYQTRLGDSCPQRTEYLPQRAGMVTDVRTGRQQFMVPGGGNGMIDPATGQRHELISPQPSRQVRDAAQPVTRDDACAEAKSRLNAAQTNPDRTMNSLRAAESKYAAMCGG